MGLTSEQQRAAEAKGSVAVIAGAGTGKTHMLSARYLYFLEQGYSPLEIVALTFTDKAVAELRSRIRATVAQKMPDRLDLLAQLEASQISTFHSLAGRICREHPEAAVVPASFQMLDDFEGQIWQASTFATLLDRLPREYSDLIPYSLLKEALTLFLNDPLTAEKALSRDRHHWQPIIQQQQAQALQALLKHPDWQSAKQVLQSCQAPGDKLDSYRLEGLAAIAALESEGDLEANLTILADLKINIGSAKNWGGADTLATVKTAIKNLRGLAQDALKVGLILLKVNESDDACEAILPVLRQALTWMRSQMDEAKFQQRVLDFVDLEVHALQALQHPSVRDYYAQRWKVFLIDEFQDTNPIQGEYLEHLTHGAIVTIVGDVKQSIYGFRRADVRVFQQWQTKIEQNLGEVVSLNISFRSHQTLISQINQVFQPILGDIHQELRAHRTQAPHSAPHLTLVYLPKDKDLGQKLSLEQRRRIEGQHLADLIEKMLADKISVHDKKTDRLRPIIPADIAILTRTWEPLETYGQVIAERGIPILQSKGGNLLETREAKDAIALLRFLADPSDDLALIAILRSPFFAISDISLFKAAQTLPDKASWWQHLKTLDIDLFEPAIATLSQLLLERRSELPTRLLQIADRLTGYTAVIANLPNGDRRLADWWGLSELIRRLETESGDLLGGVRKLRILIANGSKIERPSLAGGDAVNLMTIHGAKGLEWAVVIVPDLARRPNQMSSRLILNPDLGVACKPDRDTDPLPALYTLIEKQQKQSDREETERILYVALTRARDRLILTSPTETGYALDLLRSPLEAILDPTPIPFNLESQITTPPIRGLSL